MSNQPPKVPPNQPTDVEKRRQKFGFWADSSIELLPDRKVRITVDNPLPDDDKLIIETNQEKVACIMTKSVAGTILGSVDPKFFDGK
jgi:hypothetical protein